LPFVFKQVFNDAIFLNSVKKFQFQEQIYSSIMWKWRFPKIFIMILMTVIFLMRTVRLQNSTCDGDEQSHC
jgi:ABC-type Fe3+-siderophore transport system permease subunit